MQLPDLRPEIGRSGSSSPVFLHSPLSFHSLCRHSLHVYLSLTVPTSACPCNIHAIPFRTTFSRLLPYLALDHFFRPPRPERRRTPHCNLAATSATISVAQQSATLLVPPTSKTKSRTSHEPASCRTVSWLTPPSINNGAFGLDLTKRFAATGRAHHRTPTWTRTRHRQPAT